MSNGWYNRDEGMTNKDFLSRYEVIDKIVFFIVL